MIIPLERGDVPWALCVAGGVTIVGLVAIVIYWAGS